MPDQIIVQDIEFNSNIGVTDDEMNVRQPMSVDLELVYVKGAFFSAADSDDLSNAIDYAQAVERVVQIGTNGKYRLVERLAEEIVHALFAEFAIAELKLWVRKLKPPIKDVHDSVGVRVIRTRADVIPEPKPAGFLLESVQFLRKGTILDVAAGRGRNALYLASLGFAVDAVDRDEQTLLELAGLVKQRRLTNVNIQALNLEHEAIRTAALDNEQYNDRYDGVLVFFYLYRPLFPALIRALKPGGVLIYETFLIDNHFHYQHPRRKEFCLEHNELFRLTQGLRILHYEEGQHEEAHGCSDKPFTARLIAQKG
ncbi:MAG: dihydroneopterin aldolase [Nitrospirota bacterium]|nr:dihydroneopterin aldolase [Nitrospirota bacterium]